MTFSASGSRAVSDLGRDDLILPFSVAPLDVRGRVTRLGPALDHILKKHAYPDQVSRLVGEAVALCALLGSSLKIEGRFQLQTRSDGVVDMLVVDFDAPDRLRAFARFDAERMAALPQATSASLLGSGHLALTIDQGPETSRYQGVVLLEGQGLEAAADQYFKQSEQIPTLVRLAVAQSVTGDGPEWRAGGLVLQSYRSRRTVSGKPICIPAMSRPASTCIGLMRMMLGRKPRRSPPRSRTTSSSTRRYRASGFSTACSTSAASTCSSRKTCATPAAARRSASRRCCATSRPWKRHDMIGPDGKIGVTCEFCGTHRSFEPAAFDPPN